MLTGPIGYRWRQVRRVGVTFVTSRGGPCATSCVLSRRIEINGWSWRGHLKMRDRPVMAPGIAGCRGQLARDAQLPSQEGAGALREVRRQGSQADGWGPRVAGLLLEDAIDGKHAFRLGDVHLEFAERARPLDTPLRLFTTRRIGERVHATPSSPKERSGSTSATCLAARCHASWSGSMSSRHATTASGSPFTLALTRLVWRNV